MHMLVAKIIALSYLNRNLRICGWTVNVPPYLQQHHEIKGNLQIYQWVLWTHSCNDVFSGLDIFELQDVVSEKCDVHHIWFKQEKGVKN